MTSKNSKAAGTIAARQDRIKGVLLGQGAGDALGVHYETGIPSHGKAAMLGGGYGFAPGEWSDDSQQAICVAQARSEPQVVAANLLAWYQSHPRDIGNQTRAVLCRVRSPRGMRQVSIAYARREEAIKRPEGWHPGTGNGSLMRTGPVCLPHLDQPEHIVTAARKISDLTHADDWSGDACVLWSLAIDQAITSGDQFDPKDDMLGGLFYIPEERREFWAKAITEAVECPPEKFRVNGSAVGCFLAALSAVSHADSLADGLQQAIAIGNDTDTVAAVAGSLLGAIHGASAVPASWRRKVWGWPGMKAADLEALALTAAGI